MVHSASCGALPGFNSFTQPWYSPPQRFAFSFRYSPRPWPDYSPRRPRSSRLTHSLRHSRHRRFIPLPRYSRISRFAPEPLSRTAAHLNSISMVRSDATIHSTVPVLSLPIDSLPRYGTLTLHDSLFSLGSLPCRGPLVFDDTPCSRHSDAAVPSYLPARPGLAVLSLPPAYSPATVLSGSAVHSLLAVLSTAITQTHSPVTVLSGGAANPAAVSRARACLRCA
jgi:hypothetical protein